MWKRAVCTKDCPDTCGLLVKVENGQIVTVNGDPVRVFSLRITKYLKSIKIIENTNQSGKISMLEQIN